MNIIKLNATASTNIFLKEMALHNEVDNLTVVVTEDQFKGKGQRGNGWSSEKGKNLTFSVFLKDFVQQHHDLFLLNIIVPLCVIEALKKFDIPNVKVKWPNDILSGNKKIAGILVENFFRSNGSIYSVIGIGLNVNQDHFPHLPQAASLKMIKDRTFSKEEILLAIMEQMQSFFSDSVELNEDEIWNKYHDFLFRKGVPTVFESAESGKFMGIIQEVNREGKLCIQLEDDSVRTFDVKEVKMYY
ncbi:biotin--[acetyl-CoA-carboxylase] ligase [Flavobacterium sediminis]|uniref:Biotin--[acetyl-CoA-carboxylase] ligase n=1 Tax=Flavobacterium sediminis TaxID=2201181 RepID=A0A2U8QWU1_9FLAO|nr:biotin--[acetyl-CoA-carboxylase] ligase [Flavobacterium sediminis]AWM14511.1 biotin--[acetyl-CoA-carboxylase] ligase [Flavobacterium sediminis]